MKYRLGKKSRVTTDPVDGLAKLLDFCLRVHAQAQRRTIYYIISCHRGTPDPYYKAWETQYTVQIADTTNCIAPVPTPPNQDPALGLRFTGDSLYQALEMAVEYLLAVLEPIPPTQNN